MLQVFLVQRCRRVSVKALEVKLEGTKPSYADLKSVNQGGDIPAFGDPFGKVLDLSLDVGNLGRYRLPLVTCPRVSVLLKDLSDVTIEHVFKHAGGGKNLPILFKTAESAAFI